MYLGNNGKDIEETTMTFSWKQHMYGA